MRCARCGTPNEAGDVFCSECGARLELAPPPPPPPPPPAAVPPTVVAPVSPPTQLRMGPHAGSPRPASLRLSTILTALLLVGLGWFLARGLDKPDGGGATPLAVSTPSASPTAQGSAEVPGPSTSPQPSSPAAPTPAASPPPSPTLPPRPSRRLSGHAHAPDHEPPHDADRVLDGNPATYWHAGHHGGHGWIEITLPRPALIRRVGLIPGRIDAGTEMFRGNDRVRFLRVELADGVTVKGELRDEPRMQYLAIDPPVRASRLRLVFTGVYRGTSWFHTIVPEVEVWGVPGGG